MMKSMPCMIYDRVVGYFAPWNLTANRGKKEEIQMRSRYNMKDTMKLKLVRYKYTDISTIGKLYIDDVFYCYTLEDRVREDGSKVYGETAIPYGTYNIEYRHEGGMIVDYSQRFSDIKNDRGMLWIKDIPGFEFVYLHVGNKSSDTLGCILLGLTVATDFVGDSVIAYKKVYPVIANALDKGEKVSITIARF